MLSSMEVSIFEDSYLYQVEYACFSHIDHMIQLIHLNWVGMSNDKTVVVFPYQKPSKIKVAKPLK